MMDEQITNATQTNDKKRKVRAMEHNQPQHGGDDDSNVKDGDDDDNFDTHMEVINLVETSITHISEALGEISMDEDHTPIVPNSPTHCTLSPTNFLAILSFPP